jgi:xylan 1,4-beta-xylosidase
MKKSGLLPYRQSLHQSWDANPSFVGFRQQHHRATMITKLAFSATAENEKAGLVVFQNEKAYHYLCKSIADDKPVVQLFQSSGDSMKLLTSTPLSSANRDCYLRVEPMDSIYTMSYSLNGSNWTKIRDVDGTILSTAKAGGFVGCVIGLYATSLGKPSANKVEFDWFDYRGDDEVFD